MFHLNNSFPPLNDQMREESNYFFNSIIYSKKIILRADAFNNYLLFLYVVVVQKLVNLVMVYSDAVSCY